MANSATHAALPYPIKNARFTLQVPYLDADGDPTDPTTPDTELSGDGGSFADCAEEVTTITGSNGMGYLTLTGAETNYSMVALCAKVASGPKATLGELYPRVLASVGTGTLSAGSAGGGTLGTLLAYDVTGCFIKTTGGTGGGGTGGANNQARKIITYNTSTGAFTVAPNWETTPSTDTTYDVLLPEGVTLGMLKALNPGTAGRTLTVDSNGKAPATIAVGDIANAAITAAAIADGAIDAATFAAGAINAAAIADGAIDAATFASGAITAAALASDAGAEIADAVWDEDLTGHVVADSAGATLGDVATGTPPTAAAIADAVWDEATSGHTTSGTFGEQCKTDIDAILAAAPPSATTIADAILSRNVSNVEGSAGEHTLCTVVLACLEASVSGSTLTIKRTDGTTTHATKTVTSDAAAEPIVGIS